MLSLSRPDWLYLLLAIPAFVLIALSTRRCLEPTRWWTGLGLRCAAWVCLVIILAEPHYVRSSKATTVVFAVDRSRSIPVELQAQAREYIEETTRKARQGDRVGIVSFDGEAQVDRMPSALLAGDLRFNLTAQPDRSDIAGALSLARAVFPPDTTRRLVLLTDGNETTGSLLDEIEAARTSGVAVDIVPLAYKAGGEVWVERLIAPAQVRPDSRVELRAVVRSRRPGHVSLAWYHNNRQIPVDDAELELTGNEQADVVTLPLDLHEPGAHAFEVRITPAIGTADTFVENNRGSAFTLVEGDGQILVLDPADTLESSALVDALRSSHMRVAHKSVAQVSLDPLTLQQFGAVVLGNISADRFNTEQQDALASYVRDLGGGLVLTGGDEAFGAGGWAGTAIEAISPVAFSFPPQQMPLPSALVIVLDRSGSMGSVVERGPETQQQVANAAAILALRSLLPIDHVGLVAFDSTAEWIVPLQRNNQPVETARRIHAIGPRGGTDIYPALKLAVQALADLGKATAVRHIILLSDGRTNDGPFDELVTSMVGQGITLSVIGVGNAMNDPMLRRLAQRGRGQYHPVNNPKTLPRIFFRETRVFRERLVFENTFTPQVSAPTSPLLAGLAGTTIPSLEGYVRTQPKPDAIVDLEYRGKQREEPVLAHWRYGMGSVVAFTSGWWPHWGGGWRGWPAFGQLWKQIAEWAMSNREAEGFEVSTRIDGDIARVHVEAVNNDLGYMNALDIRGTVVSPSIQRDPIRLKQTGAGQYEAEFTISEPGNYLIGLNVQAPSTSPGAELRGGTLRTGLTVSYSPEYRNLQAHTPLLSAAVTKSGGKLRSLDTAEQDDLFERNLPPVTSRTPIGSWALAWLLLPLFLLDVAARRLASPLALSVYVELALLAMMVGCCYLISAGAWAYTLSLIAAELAGWALRWPLLRAAFMHRVPAVVTTSASRARSMQRLRKTQERIQERLETPRASSSAQASANTPPATAAELQQPRMQPRGARDEQVAPPESEQPSGNTADRLRKAKRRVRRQWDEE